MIRHVVLPLLVLTGCATAGRTAGARPRLAALDPATIQLTPGNVTFIELRGSGYATGSASNTVHIGTLTLANVPSRDGGVIRVAIPDAIPSGSEAPPRRWVPGAYRVWVTTAAGSSDTLSLTIATGGRAP
jgi:hypothetical protein